MQTTPTRLNHVFSSCVPHPRFASFVSTMKAIIIGGFAGLLMLFVGDLRSAGEAEPFHRQVYRSFDGHKALTLISGDECELRDGDTTILCKYTKEPDALRVIATALGTNEVIYFRFTSAGIVDNHGLGLLTPEGYAEMATKIANMDREKSVREERTATLTTEAKKPTKVLGEYRASYGGWDKELHTLTVSDVDLSDKEKGFTIWFGELSSVSYDKGSSSGYDVLVVENAAKDFGSTPNFNWYFTNQQDQMTFCETLDTAVKAWRAKYHEVPQCAYFGTRRQN